ncbi:hypothetical protein H0H93_011835 [Arthromyces matolae]|nr:hypothetical protein H0H93_011835 [Arthromyces matolae]
MQNFRSLTATILATIVLFGTIATATPVPLLARDESSSQTLTMRQLEVEPQPNIASRDFSSLLPRFEESIVEFEARDDYIPPSSKVSQPLRRRDSMSDHEPEPTPTDYTLPTSDAPFTAEQHKLVEDTMEKARNAINAMDAAKRDHDRIIIISHRKYWGLVLMRARYSALRRMDPVGYVRLREYHRKERDRAADMRESYDKILSKEEKHEIDTFVQFNDIVDKKYYDPQNPSVPLHHPHQPH